MPAAPLERRSSTAVRAVPAPRRAGARGAAPILDRRSSCAAASSPISRRARRNRPGHSPMTAAASRRGHSRISGTRSARLPRRLGFPRAAAGTQCRLQTHGSRRSHGSHTPAMSTPREELRHGGRRHDRPRRRVLARCDRPAAQLRNQPGPSDPDPATDNPLLLKCAKRSASRPAAQRRIRPPTRAFVSLDSRCGS